MGTPPLLCCGSLSLAHRHSHAPSCHCSQRVEYGATIVFAVIVCVVFGLTPLYALWAYSSVVTFPRPCDGQERRSFGHADPARKGGAADWEPGDRKIAELGLVLLVIAVATGLTVWSGLVDLAGFFATFATG